MNASIDQMNNYGYNKLFSALYASYKEGKRYLVNQGGARSGKTYSILQMLYYIAKTSKSPLVISIVSESLPHLRLGVIRDFNNILRHEGIEPELIVNLSTNTYKIGISIVEFFSADSPGKVHGPARDILFLNEAVNIPYPIADHLFIRTSGTIIIDYNPVGEFWVHDKVIPLPECAFFKTTYLDNIFLPDWIRKDIENHKSNPNWWKVYGEGEIGRQEGVVFTNWHTVDAYPTNVDNVYYGLDFGFTNDPSALIKVCEQNGHLWLHEVFYELGMTNRDISLRMEQQGLIKGEDRIIADSAEPKSIYELRQYGWMIKGVTKQAGSVNHGIQLMQQYTINVTNDSLNLIKEFRNYKWEQDKMTGKFLNVPVDAFQHGIDAARYACLDKIGRRTFAIEYAN